MSETRYVPRKGFERQDADLNAACARYLFEGTSPGLPDPFGIVPTSPTPLPALDTKP